jgi:hypothetical protein
VWGNKCSCLFYLEVSDYQEADLLLPEEEQQQDEQPPLISLHAITGIRTEDTMQLEVPVGNPQFTTLIDSGSTHNFISGPAAHHVGLHFHNSNVANVVVAVTPQNRNNILERYHTTTSYYRHTHKKKTATKR